MWMLERTVQLLLEIVFPCHMTSVGYIATFHMAAQTQTVVFMKTLLIPPWSHPGTQGSFLGCGVFCLEEQLTKGTWKASFSARCSVGVGWGQFSLHPEQNHLCLHCAQRQEASDAYDQGFPDTGGQLELWGGGERLIFWG